jgi:hypothetical protein
MAFFIPTYCDSADCQYSDSDYSKETTEFQLSETEEESKDMTHEQPHQQSKVVFDKTIDFNKVIPEPTAVAYLPYTPEFIIKHASDAQIKFLTWYFDLNGKERCDKEKEINKNKQKLIDFFYTAREATYCHLMVNCRGEGTRLDKELRPVGLCTELASANCTNFCCKECCLQLNFGVCEIHSSKTAFLKHLI